MRTEIGINKRCEEIKGLARRVESIHINWDIFENLSNDGFTGIYGEVIPIDIKLRNYTTIIINLFETPKNFTFDIYFKMKKNELKVKKIKICRNEGIELVPENYIGLTFEEVLSKFRNNISGIYQNKNLDYYFLYL